MRVEEQQQDLTATPVTPVGEVSATAPRDGLHSSSSDQSCSKLLPIMPADNDFSSIYHPHDQDGHPYVGLVNQAMTCYLNSLVQSLFMTPEFRNILYEWQYNGTMEEASKNIPFQLQKLFALLQSTGKSSLETKELTASFGWEGSDAYEQHDVQELSRVMLEALEHRFRKSEEHRTFIQNLYKGTMEDFVKCSGCNRESVRQDIFNDLALAIREFGATESYKSVEEALTAFIKPEILSGSNKYKCDNCNSYQEAEKGLRFTGLPYLLAIQLKRFTVDYTSGFRVKLNDTMTFPDYLDLNGYIHDKEKKPEPQKPKMSYASAANKKSSPKPETILENEDFPSLKKETPGDADGWINKPPTCEEVQEMLKKGPYVYELFAILIHQGSATGGHYFAYIKNLEQSRWLCFNDTIVKAIDLDEVKKSFGGTGWTSNTNAYLMIYRQIDAQKNQKFTRNVDLPQHVKNWLKKWEEEESRQAFEQKRQDSMMKIRLVLNNERALSPYHNSPYGAVEHSFSRDSTGHDVVRYFCSKYAEQGIFFNPDEAVLLSVNSSFNYISHEPIDLEAPLSECTSLYYEANLIMEEKKEHFNLPVPENIALQQIRTIDILIVDVTYNLVQLCKRLCVFDSETMEGIRDRICQLIPKCHLEEYPCRMVFDSAINDDSPTLIDDYSVTINKLSVSRFSSSRFYIDCGTAPTLQQDRAVKDFTQSQMCKIIEKQKYGFGVRIVLPTANDYQKAGLKPPAKTIGMPSTTDDPSPPVSPISKKFCQLGPLNEANISSMNTQMAPPDYLCTSTASSSQMVMSSNQPQCSIVNTLPMDRFVNSAVPPDSLPSYDEAVRKDPRCSPIDGMPASTDIASSLNVFSDDVDMDIDDPASANISPNVSDNENENQPPPPYMSTWPGDWRNDPADGGAGDYMEPMMGLFDSPNNKDVGVIHNEAYHDPEYTVDIKNTYFNDNFQSQAIDLVMDSRQYTSKLIEWIARYLKLHPDNVVLYKHYNENDTKGFEMTISPDENIKSSFVSVCRISVSLRVPTAENEKLIRVVEFDMNNDASFDSWPTLFSVPASNTTTIAEFKEKCVQMMESAYAEKLVSSRIRIRDITNNGVLILNDSKTFGSRGYCYDNVVALQRLKPEEYVKCKEGTNYQSIIVRRFCPSTIEIMPPFEVLIPENDPEAVQILKKVVSDHAKIVPERLLFSEFLPKGTFSRWPFTKSASEIYDMGFIDIATVPLDFAGKMVYFIDKNETKKNLSADDRRALKIKERVEANRSQNTTFRRAERPLKIQMSSVSESEP